MTEMFWRVQLIWEMIMVVKGLVRLLYVILIRLVLVQRDFAPSSIK